VPELSGARVSSPSAEKWRQRLFGDDEHPYRTFEREVERVLPPGGTLVDAGCGRTAPVLRKFRDRAGRCIGIDLEDFTEQIPGIELKRGDLARTGLPDASVDVIMGRSVMEHVTEPELVYAEMHRVLKPGGRFVFLTASLWDYASLIAKAVPNRLHPWVVARTEGRAEADVFPTAYKTNTRSAVRRLAAQAGLDVVGFRYLGQYPAYFMFNGPLFLAASLYEKAIARFEALHFLRGWILVTLERRG